MDEIQYTGSDTNHIIHIGGNDIANKVTPNDLVEKYKKLMDMYKDNGKKMCVLGILPRWTVNDDDNIFVTNVLLERYCKANNIKFIDTWNMFAGTKRKRYYKADGIHLNDLGNLRLGKLLSEASKSNGSTFIGKTVKIDSKIARRNINLTYKREINNISDLGLNDSFLSDISETSFSCYNDASVLDSPNVDVVSGCRRNELSNQSDIDTSVSMVATASKTLEKASYATIASTKDKNPTTKVDENNTVTSSGN
jgi:hypothetical protein